MYLSKLAEDISLFYAEFESVGFLQSVLDSKWTARELKDRMRCITTNLQKYLPSDFNESIEILINTAQFRLNQSRWGGGDLVFPDFVEQYGLLHFDKSIASLELFTQLSTAEFAVRPFIIAFPEKMMQQMLLWASHPNEHVRRLASEGCRPRLPWGMVIKDLVQNPTPIFPILELLFHDSSEYVRKSVSNNLNDISKDNPSEVLEFCKNMRNGKPETERIIKHGLRTLLKQGNAKALNFFNFSKEIEVRDLSFSLDKAVVKIGEKMQMKLEFSVSENQNIRLEYRIYFSRPGGNLTSKLFHWTERKISETTHLRLIKNHSFADVSIRKHYPGEHKVELFINGNCLADTIFHLKV